MSFRARANIGLVIIAAIGAVLLAGCEEQELTRLDKALAAVEGGDASAQDYIELGRAFTEESLFNDAFVAFSTARRVDPTSAEAAYEVARTDIYLGDSEHGMAVAQAAIDLDPKHSKAHEVLGRHLLLRGSPKEAAERFKQSLKLDPKNTVARLHLVSAYGAMGKPKAALDTAREAVKSAPDEAETHYVYAELLRSQGKMKAAEKSLRNVIRLDKDHQAALLNMAALLLQTERNPEEARSLAKRANDINPGNGTAAALAGWALHELGKADDGRRELETACLAHPHNWEIWLIFARVLKADGYDEASERALTMALRTAPRPEPTPQEQRVIDEMREEAGHDRPILVDPEKLREMAAPEPGDSSQSTPPPDGEAPAQKPPATPDQEPGDSSQPTTPPDGEAPAPDAAAEGGDPRS